MDGVVFETGGGPMGAGVDAVGRGAEGLWTKTENQ